MEVISLKNIDKGSKIALLRELGYESDGTYVLKDGKQYIDGYINEPVMLDNMMIVPGFPHSAFFPRKGWSALVMDDNPLSIAAYFEEHGELF